MTCGEIINPLHLNISMHILDTVLFTFPNVPKENIFSNQERL